MQILKHVISLRETYISLQDQLVAENFLLTNYRAVVSHARIYLQCFRALEFFQQRYSEYLKVLALNLQQAYESLPFNRRQIVELVRVTQQDINRYKTSTIDMRGDINARLLHGKKTFFWMLDRVYHLWERQEFKAAEQAVYATREMVLDKDPALKLYLLSALISMQFSAANLRLLQIRKIVVIEKFDINAPDEKDNFLQQQSQMEQLFIAAKNAFDMAIGLLVKFEELISVTDDPAQKAQQTAVLFSLLREKINALSMMLETVQKLKASYGEIEKNGIRSDQQCEAVISSNIRLFSAAEITKHKYNEIVFDILFDHTQFEVDSSKWSDLMAAISQTQFYENVAEEAARSPEGKKGVDPKLWVPLERVVRGHLQLAIAYLFFAKKAMSFSDWEDRHRVDYARTILNWVLTENPKSVTNEARTKYFPAVAFFKTEARRIEREEKLQVKATLSPRPVILALRPSA